MRRILLAVGAAALGLGLAVAVVGLPDCGSGAPVAVGVADEPADAPRAVAPGVQGGSVVQRPERATRPELHDPERVDPQQGALRREADERMREGLEHHARHDSQRWSEFAEALAADGVDAALLQRVEQMAERIASEAHLDALNRRPFDLFEAERALIRDLRGQVGDNHAEMLDELERNAVAVVQGARHPDLGER